MERANREMFDFLVDVQDRVVDNQWPWLRSLPVSKALQEDIFDQLCLVTGMMVDAIVNPEKFEQVMNQE